MKGAQSNVEEVISGTDDILSKALGTVEHRGQVRGMGKYITPHQYFYLPKTVKEYMASENKKFDNRFSKLEGAVDRLQKNCFNNVSEGASCQWGDDDDGHELNEELVVSIGLIQPQVFHYPNKSMSCYN